MNAPGTPWAYSGQQMRTPSAAARQVAKLCDRRRSNGTLGVEVGVGANEKLGCPSPSVNPTRQTPRVVAEVAAAVILWVSRSLCSIRRILRGSPRSSTRSGQRHDARHRRPCEAQRPSPTAGATTSRARQNHRAAPCRERRWQRRRRRDPGDAAQRHEECADHARDRPEGGSS